MPCHSCFSVYISSYKSKVLSLYSTATQHTWRRGLVLGNAPDARKLRWRYQHVGILEPTQNVKFASPPTQNVKFALPPTPTPDASQWNIGGFGSPTQDFCVGHIHFMLFMSISFASGTQRKLVFQWNMGLTPRTIIGHIALSEFGLKSPTCSSLRHYCRCILRCDSPFSGIHHTSTE